MDTMKDTEGRRLWTAGGGMVVLSMFLAILPEASEVRRPPIVGIAHVAFRVSDLSKARAFYGDLLGFEEAHRFDSGSTRVHVFKVNDRQYIEIVPDLPPEEDERLSHLALETPDLEGMGAYLAARGADLSSAPTRRKDGILTLGVSDPDGHRLQFIQYLPESMTWRLKGSYLTKRRISDRILHVGITVADPARADAFYRDILGFSEIWRGGRDDTVTNWINMRVPDGTDYIEYMLVSGRVDRRQLGVLHHVALQVPDIQQALETLRERPLGWDPETVRSPQVGRNNRWQLNLYDAEGTRVELMEPFTIR